MSKSPKRHGCLTTYLVFLVICAILGMLINLFGIPEVILKYFLNRPQWPTYFYAETYPNRAEWAIPVSFIMQIFSLICVIQIFHWRKWGFWGLCALYLANFILYLKYDVRPPLIGPILAIVVLYGVLHIGKENKGWTQLK